MCRNIIFVSFQGFINQKPIGMCKFLYPFYKQIKDNFPDDRIKYYISYKDISDDSILIVSSTYKILMKLSSLFKRYPRLFPSYTIRLLQEWLFDYFVSLHIKEPVTIISSAYLYRTTEKNKKLGGINYFIAGNPDDYEIYQILKREMNKFNIHITDAYTYKRRINFISNSLFSFDRISTFSISEYHSFRKRFEHSKISFIEHYIIPDNQLFANLKIKRKRLSFCFISHPFWLKGLQYLLEAWEKLDANNSILIIGGRLDKKLEYYVNKRFNNLVNIKYLGWVKDLNLFYRSNHVCIIPSLLDAGPVTVAEAMYCGLPVIVSDGCGSKTLVEEGKNGFVVPSGNSDAIAEKMKWFIDNLDKIEDMGKQATQTIIELAKSDQNEKVAQYILNNINEV